MTTNETAQGIAHHAQLVTWLLVCIGWFASTYCGYLFGARKYAQEKAESVLEEVSQLIEEGDRLTRELERSFDRREEKSARESLWRDFLALQRKYETGKTKLQFQLNKYFGFEIAGKVDAVLDALLYDLTFPELCEEHGQFSRNFVAYFEIWSGNMAGTDPDAEPGCKWQMMRKCGMDTSPYIKLIRANNEAREKSNGGQEQQ